MGTIRRTRHAVVVLGIAMLAYGASGAWRDGADPAREAPASDRAATPVRGTMVYYGRLGVPFLPRDGRIALSGAPLRAPKGDAQPDASRRPCPNRPRLAAPSHAPKLARPDGA